MVHDWIRCDMMLHDVTCCYMMLNDVTWCVVILFDVLWCSLMFYNVIWCFMMFPMLFDVSDLIWCCLVFYDVSDLIWCYMSYMFFLMLYRGFLGVPKKSPCSLFTVCPPPIRPERVNKLVKHRFSGHKRRVACSMRMHLRTAPNWSPEHIPRMCRLGPGGELELYTNMAFWEPRSAELWDTFSGWPWTWWGSMLLFPLGGFLK